MTPFTQFLRRTGLAVAFAGAIAIPASWLAYRHFDRTPGELMRYAERRLIGHPKLEFVILPAFGRIRPLIERPVTGPLPNLGKGQQAGALPPQRYTVQGSPLATTVRETSTQANQVDSIISISSETGLRQAIASSRTGQVIEIAPGTYVIGNSISVKNAGLPEKPIIVRAREPGSVKLFFSGVEGFAVSAPYWIFENLLIQGNCKNDEDCEHAFHVFGKAHGTVIRNNHILDFNAHIKVNGHDGNWPDDGLLQFNTLSNTRSRQTHRPVTPVDIVGANNWQVADNLVGNFVKRQGNQISFGIFIKGAAQGGRIERNLVICTDTEISQAGSRVGISFGNGGTEHQLCRDARCITEHTNGVIANNIVAHCNDFGIYINNSSQTLIAYNTLINTYGIDVRFPAASATVYANMLDSRIRSRDAGILESIHNHVVSRPSSLRAADKLNFSWIARIPQGPTDATVKSDFCNKARQLISPPGAIQSTTPDFEGC